MPDRLADLLFLAGAGYAAAAVSGGVSAGWIAASLAVLTAYVRSLGAAQGLANFFAGPMSKPRRMWVLALACLLSLLEAPLIAPMGLPRGSILVLALVIIGVGSLLTVGLRLRLIGRALQRRARDTAADGDA